MTESTKSRACPQCRAVGHDKDGSHLFLARDGVTWICNKPYHKLYLERDGIAYQDYKEPEEAMNIEDIVKLPMMGNVDRCISKSTHEHFKVRTECSEATGLPLAVYYPETSSGSFIGFKKRILPKKFSSVGNGRTGVPDFWGSHCCPKSGKKLLITGGEEDCMAAYEMLLERYPEYTPAVVSVPRGETSSQQTFSENMSLFEGFEEILLCMDMDDAGKKAVSQYAPMIGDKVRVMVFSEKDISDMRVKGKQQEFLNSYFKAREWRPSNIVKVGDILAEAVKPVPWGLSYPFRQLTELTYGIKKGGEIIGIGGAPGKENCPIR